jgi:hypothetical protein
MIFVKFSINAAEKYKTITLGWNDLLSSLPQRFVFSQYSHSKNFF